MGVGKPGGGVDEVTGQVLGIRGGERGGEGGEGSSSLIGESLHLQAGM